MSESPADLSDGMTEGAPPACMQNRELSWLSFNERVLEEADAPENPLFERSFFLSIFTSNLDEFYMIRVGGLRDHVVNKTGVIDNKTGMDAARQLDLVYGETVRLYASRDAVCQKLESDLAAEGIVRVSPQTQFANKKDRRALESYFDEQLRPMLAPQIIDQSHPFPHLENKRQIVMLALDSKGSKTTFGMIPIPYGAERLYYLTDGSHILIEDIILHYCDKIFKHYKVIEKAIASVTRNADIIAEEERFDEDEDFRDHMRKLLKKRRRLAPVRLEVRGGPCGKLVAYLQKKLALEPAQTFYSLSPLDMSYYAELRDRSQPDVRRRLSYEPYEPAVTPPVNPAAGMLRRARYGDILLSHPYESILPFFTILREAAEDSHVLSIYITLYRIDGRSKLAEHLILAAENGKDVYVFIELRARLDEENNMAWARRMDEAGCHVFYGPAGFKLHAKICLITRREGVRNEYITQIGTGNYNEKTSRLYTDLSLITVNESIGRDAVSFFHNMMIGATGDMRSYALLKESPRRFKGELLERLKSEAEKGGGGRVTIKCNSLTDRDVIIALAEASRAGVKIDLIIRGICCLVAGIPGQTENIRVRSIVGRFLEHSRVYRFGEGAGNVIYIGSGDMMTRNTERRIELFAPVLDPGIKRRISDMLDIMLKDNVKAREMNPDGQYARAAAYPDAPRDSGATDGATGAIGGAANAVGGAPAGGAAYGVSDAADIAAGAYEEDPAGAPVAEYIDSQRYFMAEAIRNASYETVKMPDERHFLKNAADLVTSLISRGRRPRRPAQNKN